MPFEGGFGSGTHVDFTYTYHVHNVRVISPVQSDRTEVNKVTVHQLQHHLTDLHEYAEYTMWVSAFNANGEGAYSAEIVARTHSDIPADPPENATVEAASSTSLIVRWEPPPKESRNGVITGYKLRWRPHGRGKSDMVTTDGSRRLYAVTGLAKGADYQLKVSALTVNGTGPATPWMEAATFATDLDESSVPGQPSWLRARSAYDQITIAWAPPRDNRILVRGYKIGWGRGIPDEYFKLVGDNERTFSIPDLRPNVQYIITLRAYNNIGDGRPIYENTRTKDESDRLDEFAAPLKTPYNVHARILSSKTSLVTWSDSTLPRNQLIPDNRYYIVRYTTTKSLKGAGHHGGKPRHEYRNSSDLNLMLYDLRPNTEYEFVVKVVKGRRQSKWSMVTTNRTEEAAPSSPPRDLVVRQGAEGLVLNWRPPKYPNGAINGYVIQYTTDRRANERDWFVEAIVGDVTAALIRNVEPATKYFFKMSARNHKGYGPSGQIQTFTTGRGKKTRLSILSMKINCNEILIVLPTPGGALAPTLTSPADTNSGVSPVILYAVAGVGAGVIIVVVIGAVVVVHRCTKSSDNGGAQAERNKTYLNGEVRGQYSYSLKCLRVIHEFTYVARATERKAESS